MSLFLDNKFLSLLSPYLSHFKKVGENLYNFRCPICGDSRISESKARGYIYQRHDKNGLSFICHNCGASYTFSHFIKTINPSLAKDYIFESIKEKRENDLSYIDESKNDYSFFRTKEISSSTNYHDSNLDYLTPINELPKDNQCIQYVQSRKIPIEHYNKLYYTDNFKHFVNQIIPNKFQNEFKEARLVIPYLNTHGKMVALVGRALDSNNPIRYFTIKVDEDAPRIFGLDTVSYSKPIYVTEGAIDSLFLPNSLACSGSSFDSPLIEQIKTNCTIVYDNEPRNPQICAQIKKMLQRKYKVCLWEEGLPFKDINEAILTGYSQSDILELINRNTVSGLPGLVKFAQWKKC